MSTTLEHAWQESIRPTLTDLHGVAWFLSTPKGMNYFKILFDRGQDCERDDWASWQIPTDANPAIDPEEIQAARLDMTEAAFSQENLALFVSWESSVFRRVGEAATASRCRSTARVWARPGIRKSGWAATRRFTAASR